MRNRPVCTGHVGFTTVELVLVVALIAIMAAVAIPMYQGYLSNAKISVARANAESLRLFMQDHQLSNGTYVAVADQFIYTQSKTSNGISDNYGWNPNGDAGLYSYEVTAASNTWHVLVTHQDGTWLRCQDRMHNCCAIGDTGASPTAC